MSDEGVRALLAWVNRHCFVASFLAAGPLALIVYWPYLQISTAFSDAWAALANARWDDRSYLAQALGCFSGADTRPVACIFRIVETDILGLRPSLWFAGALMLLVVAGATLVWILRACGTPWLVAASAGGALVVLPSANAVRLWPINGAGAALAGVLAFVALGMNAVRPGVGRRRRLLVAAIAILALALALGSYEAVALLPLAAIVPFLRVAGCRWHAWALWGGGLLCVVGFAAFRLTTRAVDVAPVEQSSSVASRITELIRAAFDVLVQSVLPQLSSAWSLLAVTGVLVAAATLLWRADGAPPWITSALASLAMGAIVIVLGVTPFVLTDRWYTPRLVGTDNRVNAASQLGYALVLAALVGLTYAVVSGASQWAGLGRRGAIGLSTALVLALAAPGALHAVHENRFQQNDWLGAATQVDAAFRTLQKTLPSFPGVAVVYLFDVSGVTRNWVPIVGWWEGSNMARYIVGDGAPAVGPFSRVRCTATGVESLAAPSVPSATYGKVLLLNVQSGKFLRPATFADCRRFALANPAPRDFS